MNIKEAKNYIKDSVRIYLKKDAEGEYRIPIVRQRPIFLLGAPGIGKTAIMEQIAQELGIALVSYSMTHHTRQSALGLPFIMHKEYEGRSYDVSEYTMSEIIASIYDVMAESGIREGILFLDEINCVSETLAPSMLQFLQYKVFGRHHHGPLKDSGGGGGLRNLEGICQGTRRAYGDPELSGYEKGRLLSGGDDRAGQKLYYRKGLGRPVGDADIV